MKIEELKRFKRILLLGYGVEGKSTHRFFQKFLPEIEVIIADQKNSPDYLKLQDDVELVIKSPGIRKDLVYKPYTTATNIFFANTKSNVVGITGTKGKSTLSTLLHQVLDASKTKNYLLGNIGFPMLDAITDNFDSDAISIVELSSYQLEDIQYSPHIAVFINIYFETHNHKSFEEYFLAKSNITRFQTEDDYFIFNPKIKKISELADISLAKKEPIDLNYKINISNIALLGPHNYQTVCALHSIIKVLKIDEKLIEKVIASFNPLPHRMNFVGNYSGIDFYNDSGANNPVATVGALEGLKPVHSLILGGQDRDFDFYDVVKKLKKAEVKVLILFPDCDKKIVKLLEQNNIKGIKVLVTDSMQSAVDFVFENTPRGQKCLLSPGAPSYLMYENFPKRGEDFIAKIKVHEKAKIT